MTNKKLVGLRNIIVVFLSALMLLLSGVVIENKADDSILSISSNVDQSDLSCTVPADTKTNYDFKENTVPTLISDFTFENETQNIETGLERKLYLLNNLKGVSPSVLTKAIYFDIVYSSDGNSLLFGFYFSINP